MVKLQELLGIELPIIQAPMAGVQGTPLAAAVCNAGGLGSLPCAMLSPMPSLPLKLAPQVQTVPSDLRTVALLAPPQMETTSAAKAAWDRVIARDTGARQRLTNV